MGRLFIRFIQDGVSIVFLRAALRAPKTIAPCSSYTMPRYTSMTTPTSPCRFFARWILGVLCVLVGSATYGQALDLSELKPLHGALRTCQGEACKAISDSLGQRLESLLDSAPEGSEMVKPDFLAAVTSADGKLTVLTWNWPQADRTSSYAGLVAFRSDQGAPLEFTALYDESSADAPDPQRAVQSPDWHGALYYDMVPDAVDKGTWILLGWDDADALVTRKVIEPIQIRGRGVRFGAPTLNGTMGMSRRWVLEYADAVQVSLRYQPEKKGKAGHSERIVFDHLAPSEPHLTGITAYYGPDMTFDAFVPGKKPNTPWQLAPNTTPIQVLPSDRPFLDPRPRNRRRNEP